jgi:eukaryotic-like serine/threonine-protein kinase
VTWDACGDTWSVTEENINDVTENADSESRLADSGDVDGDLKQIGRYRVEKILGEGGFGRVYLAHDEQLQRSVAIKVPHGRLVADQDDALAYLAEAQMVAKLDHPSIVPVHDVGVTSECPCYVVSKYVEGTDLANELKHRQFTPAEVAELVATIAEAIHYAHKKGIVHRDIKPGNILLDQKGKPYVVDFGLALKEEDVGTGPRCAGTPAYMSPEQASGEGHRVDGRSDIFSLGVVCYELLSGKKPFRGKTRSELFHQVICCDAKPLRQYDETLSPELERICFKALAKRVSDRYLSAFDLAEDLRLAAAGLLSQGTSDDSTRVFSGAVDTDNGGHSKTSVLSLDFSHDTETGLPSDIGSSAIVPKGLRSFDSHDADFFFDLLPGPRDREGLPDCLRFWKRKIEETDVDATFSVGLIYGPSGCGKSSLVKAGLLPCLSGDVIPVYLEAAAGETESRLLRCLRKSCPNVSRGLELKETLASLRRGEGVLAGKKVLIVIDQFEQWLHTTDANDRTELVQALRQCSGGAVQCIVMVRDDFWLAVSRFFRDLEVRLVEGENSGLADLFDFHHAQKVLIAFGKAHGRLPRDTNLMSKDQLAFIKQSVEGMSENGKVVCVRLALYAEMMKAKDWTLAALKAVGGTKGVGVAFLDETFSSNTSPPEYRYHQRAARRVLQSLLPDSRTVIKGHMRPAADLPEVCGYQDRPKDFAELIRVLDVELRLISPTDPDGRTVDDEHSTEEEATEQGHSEQGHSEQGHSEQGHSDAGMSQSGMQKNGKRQEYYQLTHDYLVPAIREWLNRKQQETRRGRAALKLSELATVWNGGQENRYLPTFTEWVRMLVLTDAKRWSEMERAMMARSRRVHGTRVCLALAVIVVGLIGFSTFEAARQREQALVISQQKEADRRVLAATLVDSLLEADVSKVNQIIARLIDYSADVGDDLRLVVQNEADDSNAKFHAALALLPNDKSVLPFLKARLLTVSAEQFPVVRDLMFPDRAEVIDHCWDRIESGGKTPERFRAACVLANYDPESSKWQDEGLCRFISDELVSADPTELLQWTQAFEPVSAALIIPLTVIHADKDRGESKREFATNVATRYLKDEPEQLFDLLDGANDKQFVLIANALDGHRERAIELAFAQLAESANGEESDLLRDELAMRQAAAATLLMHLKLSDSVWPLLKRNAAPGLRGHLIHWLATRSPNPEMLISRFKIEQDKGIRCAILLSLGKHELSNSEKLSVQNELNALYSNDPDPGLHSIIEWLLRGWDRFEALEKSQQHVQVSDKGRLEPGTRWYSTSQGQTFVVLEASEFLMGAPDSEAGFNEREVLHRQQLNRKFAIASTEVTHGQWRAFSLDVPELQWKADNERLAVDGAVLTDEVPMFGMEWFEAALYCNWLSEREGIPRDQWCYLPNDEGLYRSGMRAKEEFWKLGGYRLPTEAEWEFACRAQSLAARSYGVAESLLPSFAWCPQNADGRLHPVGLLMPNDFGIFDMYGNAAEWCFDEYPESFLEAGELVADEPSVQKVTEKEFRLVRGGSFKDLPDRLRSASRVKNLAGARNRNYGFRPVRTISK